MSDLRESWEDVVGRIRSAATVLVLTDLDGTLADLADHPGLVRIPAPARDSLAALAAHRRCVAGVVSGRALADVVGRVGLPGLWYVGNHGYELRTPSGDDFRFYDATELKYLDAVSRELADLTRDIPGVLLEPKGPALAVHFRRVDPEEIRDVEGAFLEVIGRHHHRVSMTRGKQVLEARLRAPFSKGTGVRHIRKEVPAGALAFYFGDDATDQDAFRELRGEGVTVSVGGGAPGFAQYRLPDPAAVLQVLDRIRAAVGP